jgi:hypothetical protein
VPGARSFYPQMTQLSQIEQDHDAFDLCYLRHLWAKTRADARGGSPSGLKVGGGLPFASMRSLCSLWFEGFCRKEHKEHKRSGAAAGSEVCCRGAVLLPADHADITDREGL